MPRRRRVRPRVLRPWVAQSCGTTTRNFGHAGRLRESMCGMKPCAPYLVAQFLLPVRPHWRGWSHVAFQSDGSAHASSR